MSLPGICACFRFCYPRSRCASRRSCSSFCRIAAPLPRGTCRLPKPAVGRAVPVLPRVADGVLPQSHVGTSDLSDSSPSSFNLSFSTSILVSWNVDVYHGDLEPLPATRYKPLTVLASIEGQLRSVLLDTGASLSLANDQFIAHLPGNIALHPVPPGLRPMAANAQPIPIIGIANLSVSLAASPTKSMWPS